MSVLLTGFPGFLASALVPRIAARTDGELRCIVQPRYASTAEERAEALGQTHDAVRGRIRLVEGDITRPGLGVDDVAALVDGVTEVWHLAAVYDLAVERDLGMQVNVHGTRHVLDVAQRCDDLARFQYFSTCYVSGRHVGPFAEDDLEVGATFNNHYEETKHLAEVEVRERMIAGLPATIYRPSIVVGDSATGETQKFDGPYFVIQLLLRQAQRAVLPVPGDPRTARFNMVPRDFVIDATAHLSGLPGSLGRTYQLADHRPLTVDQLIDDLARATGRRVLRVRVPRRAAAWSVRRVPGVHRLLRVPAESLAYFTHPTHYLTDHTRADLAGSGIEAPAVPTYSDRLVAFMEAHPEVTSAAMV